MLTEINLTGNNIGVEGGKAIGEALKVNSYDSFSCTFDII